MYILLHELIFIIWIALCLGLAVFGMGTKDKTVYWFAISGLVSSVFLLVVSFGIRALRFYMEWT